MSCSRTSACAESASSFAIPRSTQASSKSLEQLMGTPAPPTPDSFDVVVLPHLHAARRLARSLMWNDHDAEDAVQEASLRALRYFHTFAGGNGRAWFLRIVRNTCHGWRGRAVDACTDPFDEVQHSVDPVSYTHLTLPTSDLV